MPAASELVASNRSEEEVSRFIGADWLVYQDLSDLIAAVSHDNADVDGFDTSCFSGEYVTGDISATYLARLERERSDAAKAQRENLRRRVEGDLDEYASLDDGKDAGPQAGAA
jgi:amidophosphoribosyltransferase